MKEESEESKEVATRIRKTKERTKTTKVEEILRSSTLHLDVQKTNE